MKIVHMDAKFCVVGKCAALDPTSTRGASRKWFTSPEVAAEHAAGLLFHNSHGHDKGTTELYVVQIVRVVRVPVNHEIVVVE